MEHLEIRQQGGNSYGVEQPIGHYMDYALSSLFFISFSHALAEIPQVAVCLYSSHLDFVNSL